MTDPALLPILLITLVLALIAAGGLVLLGAYVVGTYRHAGQILTRWAAGNGYRLIESERRYLHKGPFTWTSSQSQIIYRVTVQDADGHTRRGWVRCGSFFLGPWKDAVDVRWDD